MALTPEAIQDIQERLVHAARPLIFFDDDADGLTSFLLTYTYNKNAIPLRAAMGPELKTDFKRYVDEHQPDLILVLDKPRADPEFFKEVRTPTIWLDHHDPTVQEPHTWPYNHLTYYNPALGNTEDHRPVAYWMRQVTNGPLWLATLGVTSDWDTSLLDAFREEHPALAPETNDIHEALFNSPLGEIIRVLNFSLKGRTSAINKNLQALTKITQPQELLETNTPASKHIHKHTKPLLKEYQRQLQEALSSDEEEDLFVHVFEHIEQSFVADIANELLIRTQANVIVVARNDGKRVNLSMRSHDVELPPILEYALQTVDGYGGGHTNACGGSVAVTNWEEFLSRVKEQIPQD